VRSNRAAQAGTSELRNRRLLATTFMQRGMRPEAKAQTGFVARDGPSCVPDPAIAVDRRRRAA
jgi:hypothetical protein